MSVAFDEYSQANVAREATEKQADSAISTIQNTLRPLFNSWKNCYLINNGLDPVPAQFMTGLSRQSVDIETVQNQFVIFHNAWMGYQEAALNAKKAYDRLTPAERAVIKITP